MFNPLKLPVRLLEPRDSRGGNRRAPPHGAHPPLPGALVRPGQRNIIFGVTGSVAGRNYWVAGLKIGYEYRAHVYYVVAWSAAVACVTTHVRDRHFDACPDAGERAQAIVERMARDQS